MTFDEYFKLKGVTLNITNGCNLNCVYCFEHSKNPRHMSVEDAVKIYDKCYNNYLKADYKEPFLVNFFGGEPFLNFEVMEAVMKYAKDNGHKSEFGATTNLTILNDHMIEVMDAYNLAVLVSIDGIKEIHDRNRCGSYDIVEKNVHKLLEKGLGRLLEARITIMPKDVPYLLESVKSVFEMGFDFIAPVPVTDTFWTPEEIADFKKADEDIWDWVIEKFNDENNKRNIQVKLVEDYLEKMLWVPVNEYQRKICSAGSPESCSIGVEGDILPCHQRHTVKEGYEELKMGNILNSDEVIKPDFACGEVKGAFPCEDCPALAVCKGGCPSENFTYNQDSNQLNEIQCLLMMAMAIVAIEKQHEIMNCKNIRSHRLNVLKTNMEIMSLLMNKVLPSKNTEEFNKNLHDFYGKFMNCKDLLIDTFADAIERILENVINIYNDDSEEK